MGWNYRILREETRYGEGYYSIHSVLYAPASGRELDPMGEKLPKGEGMPIAWSSDPFSVGGETLDELRSDFDLMAQAFEKPVLTPEEIRASRDEYTRRHRHYYRWWRKAMRFFTFGVTS